MWEIKDAIIRIVSVKSILKRAINQSNTWLVF